jgi:hypothetical protein
VHVPASQTLDPVPERIKQAQPGPIAKMPDGYHKCNKSEDRREKEEYEVKKG